MKTVGKKVQMQFNNMDIQTLNQVSAENQNRYSTGIFYLDNLLGGGLVAGETILFAGLPGAGKSTFLLQVAYQLSVGQNKKVLYVNGEESKEAIKSRAERLFINSNTIFLFDETKVENIILASNEIKPEVMIVDSLQTLTSITLKTAPSTPSQMRMSLMLLCALAKKNGITIFFVGHSTKGGYVAGLQTLQHMVDVVFFLGVNDNSTRFLKASKNRYGEALNSKDLYMTPYGLTDDMQETRPNSIIRDIPYTEAQIRAKIQGNFFMKPLVLASLDWLKSMAREKGLLSQTTTISSHQINDLLKEHPNFMVRDTLNWLEKTFKEEKEKN